MMAQKLFDYRKDIHNLHFLRLSDIIAGLATQQYLVSGYFHVRNVAQSW